MARMQGFQNRSSSKDSPDDYPTPPWATRALCAHILPDGLEDFTCWEPAANRGHMARPLAEYFGTVIGSDKFDYGAGYPLIDFLDGPTPADYGQQVHWIITNPPFNAAEDFALRALDIAEDGVALFVRASWLEGKSRFANLFTPHPPTYVCPYVERVALVKGRLDQKAATQMPYAWFIWDKTMNTKSTRVLWIPPSRADFERESDYAGE